ncbi:hypothetical protein BU16DRAFT_523057 [Lophium mytilinum]|uniref:Uncharacterized protein n=1 Tax=Lophium mytilinum TaxID=390894 RepID=A0A6A6R6P0_9PEZI|nr:hypothetical protein BU16DRAFT_523057 [Lophium mytilinum]
MSFKITVQMEWFGLTIANCAPSFLAAAHLHNAAKHLNALPTPWPAMQSLCDLHCAKIFGGSAPPTAPFEMLRRYFLQIGVPLSKFAVNARDSSMLRTRGQKRLALPLDPALELLRSCFGPDSKLERTVRQIGALDLVSGEEKLEVLSRFRGWLSRAVQAPKPEYVELSLASEKIVARICAERRRGEDAVEMVAGVLEGVVLGFWEWERESRRERGEFVAPQALKDCGVTLGQF